MLCVRRKFATIRDSEAVDSMLGSLRWVIPVGARHRPGLPFSERSIPSGPDSLVQIVSVAYLTKHARWLSHFLRDGSQQPRSRSTLKPLAACWPVPACVM
jgi:hypothetical protein